VAEGLCAVMRTRGEREKKKLDVEKERALVPSSRFRKNGKKLLGRHCPAPPHQSEKNGMGKNYVQRLFQLRAMFF